MLLYILRAYILCFEPSRLCRKSTQAFKTRNRLPVVNCKIHRMYRYGNDHAFGCLFGATGLARKL